MGVNLVKGGNISLTKQAGQAGLAVVVVGLGWDLRSTTGQDFDLDSSAIACDAAGRAVDDRHFVFYGNLATPDGSIRHSGDNLTGAGEGDDEQITVDLTALTTQTERIVFPVSIYDADTRNQNFGQVRNAFIRVVNTADGSELARYDLSEDASVETAMIFGELYRNGSEWKFRATGHGYASGLRGIAEDYGLNV
ncbi:MAG: TerD family protein [Actinomycetota bacterium]|nr:TerD family protein [Actinomycetota bacterium]